MKLGKVVGQIWSTKKAEELSEYKLLQVKLIDDKDEHLIVAADNLDAGIGDRVLVVGGSAARTGDIEDFIPVDATIVAIVDNKKI